MAITGRFEADFSQFNSETQKATRELATLEGQSHQVVAAVGALGTSASAFGPLNAATTQTTSTFTQLATGLGTADKTLSLLGVHIGPEIRAIAELGAAATATAAALGTVGTAAAIVSTAIAGWQIGTKISEWTGLGDAISRAAARLLGFGDVAAQTAAAQQDVLERASTIAKRTVTDITEARGIIETSLAGINAQYDNSATRVANWNAEIRTLREKGTLAGLTKEIESHNSTVAQMSREYGISADAIGLYTRQLQAADEQQKAAEASARKLADAQQQHTDRQVAAADALTGINDLTAATELLEAIELQHIDVRNLSIAGQEMVNDVMLKGVAAAVQLGMATDPLTSRFEAVRLAATETSRAIAELTQAQADAAAAAAALEKQERSLNDAMIDAYKRSGGTQPDVFTGAELPGIGHSRMKPFVPLAPSVWAGTDINGFPRADVTAPAPGAGITQNLNFSINGTGEDVWRQFKDIMTRENMVGTMWGVTR